MTLKPAEANTGVTFIRTDLPGKPEIRALAENVSSTVKATTLSANGAEVFTVEHLMAAIALSGVDNIRIEMSSPEPPVTDGSAKVFCELLDEAGLVEQQAERKVLSAVEFQRRMNGTRKQLNELDYGTSDRSDSKEI